MIRYVAIAALILAIGLGGVAWWQHDRAKSLAADLETSQSKLSIANATIAQHQSAELIWKDRLLQAQRETRELETELSTLQNMEGRDAPLSDLLRATGDAVDRLR
jgi:uncharacterized protein HemX